MRELNAGKLRDNVAKVAQYDLDEHLTFGSAYAVYQNGVPMCVQCFGVTSPNGTEPVCPDTVFRLASMTKPIVTMGALMMIDRGLLTLDTPVTTFLPQFENIHIITPEGKDLGPTPTELTVLHLLTHTAGLGGLKPLHLSREDKTTPEAFMDYYIREGLDYEPFTNQRYNFAVAFDMINEIVRALTGQDPEAFLQAELFAPCGMRDTTFEPTESQWARMIAMHNRVDGQCCVGHTVDGCVFADYPVEHRLGGAGLASTLQDYVLFAQMLLNEGACAGGRLVSPETARLMSTPHVPYELMPQNERWGLGVRVVTDERYRRIPVGCYGWSGAYGSHFWVDPENRITAVFMKNSLIEGGSNNPSARRFEEAVYASLD